MLGELFLEFKQEGLRLQCAWRNWAKPVEIQNLPKPIGYNLSWLEVFFIVLVIFASSRIPTDLPQVLIMICLR